MNIILECVNRIGYKQFCVCVCVVCNTTLNNIIILISNAINVLKFELHSQYDNKTQNELKHSNCIHSQYTVDSIFLNHINSNWNRKSVRCDVNTYFVFKEHYFGLWQLLYGLKLLNLAKKILILNVHFSHSIQPLTNIQREKHILRANIIE